MWVDSEILNIFESGSQISSLASRRIRGFTESGPQDFDIFSDLSTSLTSAGVICIFSRTESVIICCGGRGLS